MRVVITGGSKGIGRALATEFWQRGHQVLVCGQNSTELEALAANFEHQRFYIQQCNIRELSQVEALIEQAHDCMGGVDIWVNNAGLAKTTNSILDTSQNDVETMLLTNVLGTIQCSRAAARAMVKQGHGKLFTMLGGGSDGEFFPGMGIYGSTKRALDYFTDALAKELADTGVLVGKIRPGMIITEGVIRESKADLANFKKRRHFANLVCDEPETVAPFLVDAMLSCQRTGQKIAWLSRRKLWARFIKGLFIKPADKFSAYGL